LPKGHPEEEHKSAKRKPPQSAFEYQQRKNPKLRAKSTKLVQHADLRSRETCGHGYDVASGYQLRDPVIWNDFRKRESSLAEFCCRNSIYSARPMWPPPNVGVAARSFKLASYVDIIPRISFTNSREGWFKVLSSGCGGSLR